MVEKAVVVVELVLLLELVVLRNVVMVSILVWLESGESIVVCPVVPRVLVRLAV